MSKRKKAAIGIGTAAILAAAIATPLALLPAPKAVSLTIDSSPFLFVYPGEDCSLPDALTNIGPSGLDIVSLVWGVMDIDHDPYKEWVSYDPRTGAGYVKNLEKSNPYIITHQGGLGVVWVIEGDVAWYVPMDVVDLDWNNDGFVNMLDRGALMATYGSVEGDANYNREFDSNYDGLIDDQDVAIMDDTICHSPSLEIIRDNIDTGEYIKLEWPTGTSPVSEVWLAACNNEEYIKGFTGGNYWLNGVAQYRSGWISVSRHPYSTLGYDCRMFAADTCNAAYKALGYGRILHANNIAHAFAVFWIGGDWTDLNNWRVLSPQTGKVRSATDTEGKFKVLHINFPIFASINGAPVIKCRCLTVNSIEQTVSYRGGTCSYLNHDLEEPAPEVFNTALGIPMDWGDSQ